MILMGISSGAFAQEKIPTPIIKAPDDGITVTGTGMTFEWYIVEGATKFHIQIAADRDFTMLEVDTDFGGSSTQSYTWDDLPRDGSIFYWRLRVSNDPGSDWTKTRTFLSTAPEPEPWWLSDAFIDFLLVLFVAGVMTFFAAIGIPPWMIFG